MNKTAPIYELLSQLLEHLPLHAEEGPVRECVAESQLLDHLAAGEAGQPRAAVAVVRRVFEAMALLDRKELERGNWAFVSFPASLAGRSLLATLAQPGQTLFEKHYWEQDSGRPDSSIDEQRDLLLDLESRREKHHPGHAAAPIRYVHVAWGLVRLGNRFLLYQREDKKHLGVKDFVFPGGRLRITDLPEDRQGPDALRELFSEDSALADQCLDATLQREMHEELGLHPGADYTAERWRTLNPYKKVEGARNNHVLSCWRITLFFIKLTQVGELRLLERIAAEPDAIPWFTLADLESQSRPDGASAFIDALRADFGEKFAEEMAKPPNSTGTNYLLTKETDSIDLPAEPERPFGRGKTGHEKPVLAHLSRQDWELLLLLGWCARDLEVSANLERVVALGGGWIRLKLGEDLEAARKLALTLQAADLPLIQFQGDNLRLAVTPENVYFEEELFSYKFNPGSPSGKGSTIRLMLNAIETDFGNLKSKRLDINIPPQLADLIQSIEAGRNPYSIPEIEKAKDLPGQNRQSITQKARALGLRSFLRFPEKDSPIITVPRHQG